MSHRQIDDDDDDDDDLQIRQDFPTFHDEMSLYQGSNFNKY